MNKADLSKLVLGPRQEWLAIHMRHLINCIVSSSRTITIIGHIHGELPEEVRGLLE